MLDSEMETCEQDKSVLRRRLEASAVEIERQVWPSENIEYVGNIYD